ncbi:thiol-disulfide oxidoreductase DCC family protein [Paenibacillus piri]|uniref:Thiol-disulfide oxidoreductase DCC family protein n=1 Tax=Paenibacillus piri TaxID=2547395 RepID=A0A4R5KE34_9BACL|nr:thiol-disulfide oxidoreductase DCC family protein [Paenibacillus piri]TDF93571.1 thiol-disulfide oxidoreductase DCC family protein [Paenibacillus piri]
MKEPHSSQDNSTASSYSLVLFDGVCRFCNGWVQFLIRRDSADRFRFSAIQSDYAQALLSQSCTGGKPLPDSIIVIENGTVYTHSAAVLRIFRQLGRGWPLLYGFILVPRPLRDAAYRWIAKRRYAIFGKYDSCMVPTEQVRRKFFG